MAKKLVSIFDKCNNLQLRFNCVRIWCTFFNKQWKPILIFKWKWIESNRIRYGHLRVCRKQNRRCPFTLYNEWRILKNRNLLKDPRDRDWNLVCHLPERQVIIYPILRAEKNKKQRFNDGDSQTGWKRYNKIQFS